jgi:hypothetical protein
MPRAMTAQEMMKATRAYFRNGMSSVGLKTGRPSRRVMMPAGQGELLDATAGHEGREERGEDAE